MSNGKRLGMVEIAGLTSWLVSRKEEIESNGMTVSALAAKASERLGHEVTDEQLRRILPASGIAIPRAKSPRASYKDTTTILAKAILQLEQAFDLTLDNHDVLCRIADKLGISDAEQVRPMLVGKD